uniref:Uncharacterized protein n=1 Tax=Aegilops tauschii TaxID=37682 RepID=R7WD80_AEGTA
MATNTKFSNMLLQKRCRLAYCLFPRLKNAVISQVPTTPEKKVCELGLHRTVRAGTYSSPRRGVTRGGGAYRGRAQMDMQMYRGHAVVAALVLLTTVTAASPTGYWGYLCDGGNYSAPSKYQQNLEQLSATLPEAVASSPSLFHTQAVGSSQDRAYALARCRGDTEADDCKRCLTQAFKDARAVCTFRKGISIYYDTCSLWFAEKIKIHLGDLQSVLRADGPPIPTQCKAFQNDASTLIADVARKASDSSQRHATGEKGCDERACNYTLYTLADCLPGISAAQCQLPFGALSVLQGYKRRTHEQDSLDRGGHSGRRSATGNRLATLVVVSGKFSPILNNPTNDVLYLTLDTLCSI